MYRLHGGGHWEPLRVLSRVSLVFPVVNPQGGFAGENRDRKSATWEAQGFDQKMERKERYYF